MSEPLQFSPEWPKVRCTECATVYEMPARTGAIVTGHCPKCANGTFNTTFVQSVGITMHGPAASSTPGEDGLDG